MMVVDTVCIPNNFYTIEAGRCDHFYYHEFGLRKDSEFWVRIIPEGYYDTNTLAKALQTAMNAEYKLVGEDYTVTFNTLKGVFEISNPFSYSSGQCTIYTREMLQGPSANVDFSFPNTDYNGLMDICREIGMVSAKMAHALLRAAMISRRLYHCSQAQCCNRI